jgi:hypothetical protein
MSGVYVNLRNGQLLYHKLLSLLLLRPTHGRPIARANGHDTRIYIILYTYDFVNSKPPTEYLYIYIILSCTPSRKFDSVRRIFRLFRYTSPTAPYTKSLSLGIDIPFGSPARR